MNVHDCDLLVDSMDRSMPDMLADRMVLMLRM